MTISVRRSSVEVIFFSDTREAEFAVTVLGNRMICTSIKGGILWSLTRDRASSLEGLVTDAYDGCVGHWDVKNNMHRRPLSGDGLDLEVLSNWSSQYICIQNLSNQGVLHFNFGDPWIVDLLNRFVNTGTITDTSKTVLDHLVDE